MSAVHSLVDFIKVFMKDSISQVIKLYIIGEKYDSPTWDGLSIFYVDQNEFVSMDMYIISRSFFLQHLHKNFALNHFINITIYTR